MRRRARAFMLVLLTAAAVGGCTAREIEDFLYAGGKIAYDSMKSRQQAD